jgi:hypothetical protein
VSISSIQNTVNRIQKAIADLRAKDATLAKQELNETTRANRARSDALTSRSQSTVNSKNREYEQALAKQADIQVKRADLAKQIASQCVELGRSEEQLSKEREVQRKKLLEEEKKQQQSRENSQKKHAAEEKKIQQDREAHERRLTAELRSRNIVVKKGYIHKDIKDLEYDVFISHASEDKDDFARPLAEILRKKGAKVWFDEDVLTWGVSLRRDIDAGLNAAKLGIVILSSSFFKKEWPKRELDGLTAQEVAGETRILPIWHKITVDEVRQFSPVLADKIALNTAVNSIEYISDELMKLLDI